MGIVRAPWWRQKIKERRKEIKEKIEKGELHCDDYYIEKRKYRDNLITFKDIYTSELNGLNIASKRLGE